MKVTIGFYIGRFSPFTNAHLTNALKMIDECDHCAFLIGSAFKPRTIKNPFTAEERALMIIDSIYEAKPDINTGIELFYIPDFPYNDDAWVARVQDTMRGYVSKHYGSGDEVEVRLYGAKKDDSSYYLDLFNNVNFVEAPMQYFLGRPVSATDVREALFTYRGVTPNTVIDSICPPNVKATLQAFTKTDEFTRLCNEFQHIREYKTQWENTPYPPIFVTTDAVVTCLGHVLMVERDAAPGEGLMALPGGFLNNKERIVDGAIRELREETKIKVPEPVLRGSIREVKVYDDPNRSERGRTITHAFLIRLDNERELPKVKGSDDARSARWVPLADVQFMSESIYEDHQAIILDLLRMNG